MCSFRLLGVLTLLLSISATLTVGQIAPPFARRESENRAEIDREIQQKLQLERQKKRFEDMKRDSQRLLELATQLKQYVDKSGEGILSLEVVRKAEEMEKLAHQVKKNMSAE
jgi:IS30 family transposase